MLLRRTGTKSQRTIGTLAKGNPRLDVPMRSSLKKHPKNVQLHQHKTTEKSLNTPVKHLNRHAKERFSVDINKVTKKRQ